MKTSDKAIAAIQTDAQKLETLRSYIEQNREAFDILRFCSVSPDYNLFCHPEPGMGRLFAYKLGPGEWKRDRGSDSAYYNWQGKPDNAPCSFHLFNAEVRSDMGTVIIE